MKNCRYALVAFLVWIFSVLAVSSARADLFGDDDKKWERLFVELKRIQTRLVNIETEQLKNITDSQAELLSQITKLQSLLPGVQGAVEQNGAQTQERINRLDDRLAQMEAKTNAAFDQIRRGLAGDMENIAKQNRDLMKRAEVQMDRQGKSLAALDVKNDKMVEILAKSLEEAQGTSGKVAALEKNLATLQDNLDLTRQMIDKLKEIMDARQAELLKKMAGQAENAEQSSLKLTKLIEILKTMAAEQGNGHSPAADAKKKSGGKHEKKSAPKKDAGEEE